MTLAVDDTIAGVSTAVGNGAIAIVRLSGPHSLPIAEAILRTRRELRRAPRSLCYGRVVDPASSEVVDEVLAVYLPAPRTYTRQDMVEINVHGGALPARRVLALCLRQGSRLAQPGEFTLRAFLNGRIDLTQAEAVRDLVEARTVAAARQALAQLDGNLAARLRRMRQRLLSVLAALEATIDFDVEEVERESLRQSLLMVLDEAKELLSSARTAQLIRQGVRVAIIGRPNVGKSSLLNALLGSDRAIVSPVPGTTRDTIEEAIAIQGVPIVFVDTAGITGRKADALERAGIERSQRALGQADIALLVLDSSQPLTDDDRAVAALAQAAPTVVMAWNKCDLPSVAQDSPAPHARSVRVSALTGEGLGDLQQALLEAALDGQGLPSEVALTSERQAQAVGRAATALERAVAASRLPDDMLAADIRDAIDALGEVTGETTSEDLLATVFAGFCTGK